jgi:transposase
VAGKKLWIGIDVGKQFHHTCAVNADGKTVFSRKVKNRQTAIEELITRTTTKAGTGTDGDGEVVWALDMTSGSAALLVALLAATGQPVRSVPGRLVNRMSGAFTGEATTDAKDAHTIAETARLRSDLAPVTVPNQVVGDLQVC